MVRNEMLSSYHQKQESISPFSLLFNIISPRKCNKTRKIKYIDTKKEEIKLFFHRSRLSMQKLPMNSQKIPETKNQLWQDCKTQSK